MSQPARQTHDAAAERDDVKDALTAAGRRRSAVGQPAARRSTPRRRRRGEVENTDYAAFASRVIRAHARRIAEGDVDGLADLLALRDGLDAATQVAVTGLRGFGYSWGDIASRLGTTRQAAQQRWGR